MSKQTALQKAIQSVEDRMTFTHNENRLGELNAVHIILKTLLPYEREVIQNSYNQGDEDRYDMSLLKEVPKYKNSNDYFTKTFNDNGND